MKNFLNWISYELNLTDNLSKIVANFPPDIVTLVAAFVIFWFFFKGLWQLYVVDRVVRGLKKEIKRLLSFDSLGVSQIESMKDNLKALSPLIEEFGELIHAEGRNSQNAEYIFSDEAVLLAVDVDSSSLEQYPSMFTAIGIAGTFIGILTALVGLAGNDLSSANLIQKLLDGAGIAFLTSVIGVSFSLIFLIISRGILGEFDSTLHQFQMSINNKLDRVTSESLLAEMLESFNVLADDIATGVSTALADQLKGVNEMLANSLNSAGKASETIVSGVMDGIQSSLQSFNESSSLLQSSAETQTKLVEEFQKGLTQAEKVTESFSSLLPQLSQVSSDLIESSKNFEGLPAALLEIKESHEEFISVMNESSGELSKNWESERKRMIEASNSMHKQFDSFEKGIVSGIQNSMEQFDDELARAGQYVVTWLDKMNDNVTSYEGQITSFSLASKNSYSELQTVISDFSNDIEIVAEEIKNSNQSITNSMSALADELKVQVGGVPKEFEALTVNVQQLYEETARLLPSKLEGSFDRIAKIVEESTKSRKKGFFS